jgi:hypothetical protein
LKGKLKLWKRKMEGSKIQSFPRIKHSSGCWIFCRKNVVMEHLEEPTLDYNNWNPDVMEHLEEPTLDYNSWNPDVMEHLEEPTLDYDSWNPDVMEHLEEPTLDYDSWNPDEVTKTIVCIGRALDLHEQLMEVPNDYSVPCDFTNNRWFHSGSEWNTIKKNLRSTGMEVLRPCSITYLYEAVLWALVGAGGLGVEAECNQPQHMPGFQAHLQRYEELTQLMQTRFTWICMCNVLLIFVFLKNCCVIPTKKLIINPCLACAIINILQQ